MKTLKLEGDSLNQQEALLELLRQKAPEIFTDNKIDVKQLRATLGEEVLADTERYGLNWAGKMDCFRTIQETSTNTLKPVREESVDFDNTKNLFIEGDNLEVLKVLQRSYYGKVKMIYIDPPYNTGNDFIYNDKFSRNKREYLEEVGAIDKEGNVVNAGLYTQNTKDCGHFHSDWLNMMYPRLFLARNLLDKSGIIFVSIDDNEVHNLRVIMNEIYGEENFLAQLIWKRRQNVDSRTKTGVSSDHEYVVAYRKSHEGRLRGGEKDLTKYSNPDSDPRGDWMSADMTGLATKDQRPNLHYDIIDPDTKLVYQCPPTGWRYEPKRMEGLIKNGEVLFPKNPDGRPRRKKFLKDLQEDFTGLSSILDTVFNTQGTRELREIFDDKEFFDFPKPKDFVRALIEQGTSQDDVVLDFFAGSGTTAHAVMHLNADDGGNRRWICVQLPERCKPESEATKAGFTTIADIAKERIRRAAKKIDEEDSEKRGYLNGLREVYGYDKNQIGETQANMDSQAYDFDAGFKVFKLDESNFKIWNPNVTSVEQLERQMMEMFDNVQPGATKETMMYELLLKSGKELNDAIEERVARGEKYFRINDGSLIICLADKLSKELFAEILADKPKKIIVLDKSFGNDDQLKTNLLLQAEGAGVDEVRVI